MKVVDEDGDRAGNAVMGVALMTTVFPAITLVVVVVVETVDGDDEVVDEEVVVIVDVDVVVEEEEGVIEGKLPRLAKNEPGLVGL